MIIIHGEEFIRETKTYKGLELCSSSWVGTLR